jgi:hypothetical protein
MLLFTHLANAASALLRSGAPVCRVLSLVLAALLVLLSGRAEAAAMPAADLPEAAADAVAEAPMCDPIGASVGARPEIPEARGGRVEELPCDVLAAWLGWKLSAPEFGGVAITVDEREPGQPLPVAAWPSERTPGAAVDRLAFPRRSPPLSFGFPVIDGLAPRRGHPLSVFRPPSRTC